MSWLEINNLLYLHNTAQKLKVMPRVTGNKNKTGVKMKSRQGKATA